MQIVTKGQKIGITIREDLQTQLVKHSNLIEAALQRLGEAFQRRKAVPGGSNSA